MSQKDMSGYWTDVFSHRSRNANAVNEATLSEMLRVIFPEYRLKIIRHFHNATKNQTTTTIGYLIAAAKMESVKNIVEGTEKLDDLTRALQNGEGDELYDAKTCEELHQMVAAMVMVSKDMMDGNVSPLHMATICDLNLAVKWLLEVGASTKMLDKEGCTPLLICAGINRPRIARTLCEAEADVEFRKKGGHNVVFTAVSQGHKETLEVLLEFKADPNVAHKSGSSPLWIAACNGELDCAKLLVQHGAYKNEPVNMRSVVELDDSMSDKMKNLMEQLESRGKIAKPEGEWSEDDGSNLLGILGSVNKVSSPKAGGGGEKSEKVVTKGGATPLWIAACNGHAKMVEYLMEKGANLEIMCDSTSPLWIAASHGDLPVVTVLAYRANKEARALDGATPLWVACENGHKEVARALIDAGARTQASSLDQRTCLHIAAANRHLGVVLLLMDRGADPSATAVDGSTPVHLLMSKGMTTKGAGNSEWQQILDALVAGGVEFTAKKIDGANVLHAAVANRDVDQVKYILENGQVDPNQCDEMGVSPLHAAAASGDVDIARVIVTNSDEIELDNQCTEAAKFPGATALWLAAKHGHEAVVELLLASGASLSIGDKKNNMPMMVAIEEGHTACIMLLQQATKRDMAKNKNKDFGGKGGLAYPSFVLKMGKAINNGSSPGRGTAGSSLGRR